MNLKILIGPTHSWAGSHSSITTIDNAHYFKEPQDFLSSVKEIKPDVVFLRACGHNNIPSETLKKCPIPIVGFYHDWVCWGSERLEVVAKQVDWLITEKSAYEYLKNIGIKNCSPFLLMSKHGVERALDSKITKYKDKKYDVCCLGSFMFEGYKNPLRYDERDKVGLYDNTYWSRLGFRGRSKYIEKIAQHKGEVFIGANTSNKDISEIFKSNNPSFDIISNSLINIHVDHGRKYAANRCFETMAIGTLLFCEEENEIFDYIDGNFVESYNLSNLHEKIDYYKRNPKEAESKAKQAKKFAINNLSNKALTKKLIKLIESNFTKIQDEMKVRHIINDNLDRSLVHWGGSKVTNIHKYYKKNLNNNNTSALSLNEQSNFYYDYYLLNSNKRKNLIKRTKFLVKSLLCINKSILRNNNNVVSLWNKSIILNTIGLKFFTIRQLRKCKKLAQSVSFQYNGSILEVKIDWWMSGHIEYDLAIKKISNNHFELTQKAFLYRIDMMLHMLGEKNNNIHWPDLPDEHKKINDFSMVKQLDPLNNMDSFLKEKIFDFNK